MNINDFILAGKLTGSGGGGGGGSSDFSTAKLTMVNPQEYPFTVDNYFGFPFIEDNAVQCYYSDTVEPLQSIEFDIVLYKGTAIGMCFTVADFTFSGNISEDDGVLTITGDCTITYTPEP